MKHTVAKIKITAQFNIAIKRKTNSKKKTVKTRIHKFLRC